MMTKQKTGTIIWHDLTVRNAGEVRNFYSEVVGWETSPVNMGAYDDYNMHPPGNGEEALAGVCHARGTNANLPPQWLIYVKVENVEESADKCLELGGKVLDGPRKMGGSNFCVIRDPEGAVLALMD